MPATVLPVDERSVAAARRLLGSTLDGRSTTSIDDAVLMISGLATNAVRHTQHVPLVLVSIHDHTLRVGAS